MSIIRRETDPDLINRIANDPAVLPFMRNDGEGLDFSSVAGESPTRTGVVILSNGEDAIAAFEATTDVSWQAHTMFGPTCRGRRAVETGREMVDWMFAHGASMVWGATPRSNRAACWFNRQIGAKIVGGDEEEEIYQIRKAN